MFRDTPAFSSFSVNDLDAAKKFYENTLELESEDGPMGITLKAAGTNGIFVYPKEDHVPATFTILNFAVKHIDSVVEELKAKGVVFEQYEGITDENGIARGLSNDRGPDIAWFKDPAGNVLAVMQRL